MRCLKEALEQFLSLIPIETKYCREKWKLQQTCSKLPYFAFTTVSGQVIPAHHTLYSNIYSLFLLYMYIYTYIYHFTTSVMPPYLALPCQSYTKFRPTSFYFLLPFYAFVIKILKYLST